MIPPCSRHSPFARTGGVCLMRLFLTASLVVLLARPALADFPAVQASLRQSDYAAAYDGCKAEAERDDPECQNLVGYLFQQGLGVIANPNEAVRLFRLAAAKKLVGVTDQSRTLVSGRPRRRQGRCAGGELVSTRGRATRN